jgi:hypothetical protein
MQPGRPPAVLSSMSDDPRPEGATNDRPRNETIAGTGPGIPDEALGPGQELPEPPSDEAVARLAEQLGAPVPGAGDKSG